MFSSDSDWLVVHEETNGIINGIKARHNIRHLIRISKQNTPDINRFKRQRQKMVKHTQTIRRQQPTNCLSVFDHFVGLAFKGI